VSIDFEWLESKILGRALNSEEREALGAIITAHRFDKGQNIVSQGQPGGALYILRSGTAEIASEKEGKRTHITNTMEGALFGEMTVLTGEPTSASVICTEACEVYKISREGLSSIMEHHQDLIFALFAYMLVYSSKVIRHMNEEHIAMLHYITGSRL